MVYDEQKKLAQQQAENKSRMAKYEDELARKRMQVSYPFVSDAEESTVLVIIYHIILNFLDRE